ncbi:hypothetical protein HRbin24_00059 [bacterium HR24]|nr:hypothetical protein HRbin24_00059 [bacterium HR24]
MQNLLRHTCPSCQGRFWLERLPQGTILCPYCGATVSGSGRLGRRSSAVPACTVRNGTAVPGIRTEDGLIILGEEGRGRRLTRVPLPSGASLDREGTVQALPVSHPAAVAVILIRDHSGYRGGWELLTLPREDCPLRGKLELLWEETCPVCEWWGRHGPYPVRQLRAQDLGHLIAEGYCAQGAAGRMGGGPEYLIAAPPGEFCIYRWGRLYGAPRFVGVRIYPDGRVETWDVMEALSSTRAAESW